jgi:hypothetical protein
MRKTHLLLLNGRRKGKWIWGRRSDLCFCGDAQRRGGTHCCEGSYVFVCVLRVVSARRFVWEDGFAGRFCMGGRRERGGGNLYGGRTRVSLFTMGRLIVRGGPNSWHLPSQKKVRVFSSPPFPSLPPCLPSFGLLARTLCAITKKIGPGSGALFPACAKETGPADWIVMCSGKRHPPFPLPLRPLQRSDKYSNLRSLYHPARSSVTVYLPAPLPSSHENAASLCGLRYEASFVYHLQLRTSVLPVLPPSPLLPPRSLSNTSFSFFPGSAPFTSTLLGGDTLTPHPPHTRSIPFSASGLSQEVPALPAVILATPPFFPFHRPPTSTLLFDCPLPLPCSTRELARVPGVLLALNRGLSCSSSNFTR